MTFTATYVYAASCLPTFNNGQDPYCYVNIIASSEASITMHTLGESTSFILPPGTLYKKEFDEAFHPTIGAENKAIRITSDVDIQILVYQTVSNWDYYNDVYMVPNQFRASTTYFTTSYTNNTCSSGRSQQFYLVTSFYDETFVSILQQDGTSFELELPAFGTFTQKATDGGNHLGSGTHINSNKPINVISGNLCTNNKPDGTGDSAGTYATGIPDVQSLGQQYVVPHIANEYGSPPGFTVCVVATEDGTAVECDGDMQTVNQGETAVFEYPYLDRSVFVTCSSECLVTQYAKSVSAQSGLFMQHILPDHDFSTSAYFTTLDVYPSSFLSLVVTGEAPVDGLYLNGESLSDLAWNPANGYSTAVKAISNGTYELDSVDGRAFAAYIYLHTQRSAGGAGYTMLPVELSTVTYDYAASCLPTFNNGQDPYCYVNIVTSSEASVTIHTLGESTSLILPPTTLYKKEFDEAFHPTIGAENKAIWITSNVDIQILVYQTVSSWDYYNDVYMVPNQFRASTTYFTTSYTNNTCSSGRSQQFYLVTSFYDETSVSILQQDGTSFELELPAFGTFAQKATDGSNHLGSGTHINSNKPINVISGNLCTNNKPDGTGDSAGTYATGIPDVQSLGQQYVVPHIANEYESPPGFTVCVVATEDGTTVECDGDMQTVNQGETAVFEYPYLDRSVFVTCSSECLVTQYAKSVSAQSGLFMQHMLPDHDFSTSAYFTTLDVHPSSFLSLVVTGEAPVDGIYLNGESLSDLTWNPGNGYSTAVKALSNGTYELDSVDGRAFAAYIYLHTQRRAGGAGYTMLPKESSRVSTTAASTTASTVIYTTTPAVSSTAPSVTSTTPSRPINNTLPQHTARVNGTALTEDGQEITPACAVVRQWKC